MTPSAATWEHSLMSCIHSFLLGGLLFCGCAGSMTPLVAQDGAPALFVRGLHSTLPAEEPQPLAADQILAVGEAPFVEIRTERAAYVSAVLYSHEGTSQELTLIRLSDQDPASQQLRLSVPRRAPPGVAETELWLFITASRSPLDPAVRQLLRLPCADSERRGDPEPVKTKGAKPVAEGKRSSGDSQAGRSGRPVESGPRGGPQAVVCESPAGASAPVTIRSLRLRSQ